MTPLEWLRRRAGKTRTAAALPAEPGLLAAGADRLLSDLHLLAGAAPSASVPEASAQPTGFITTSSVLTPDETEALRAGFTAIVDAAIATHEPLSGRFSIRLPTHTVDATYEHTPRAPWVPVTTAVKHTPQEKALLDSAPDRDSHCPNCVYRYSRCYCGGNQ